MDIVLTLVIDRDPKELPMEELGSLLELFAKALKAADPDVSSKYDLRYSMVKLTKGSTALAFIANDSYAGEQQVREFSRQMADPLTRQTIGAYRSLQNRCNQLNTKILVFPGKNESPSLRLVPEVVPERPLLKGETTIYGVLERIGGSSTISASVRQLGHDKITTVTLSKELAKKMGPFLYNEVCLEGEAEWDITSLEIVSFKALTFAPYNPKPIDETLNNLATLTGCGMWHDTGQTIEEFLRDLRGGSGDLI